MVFKREQMDHRMNTLIIPVIKGIDEVTDEQLEEFGFYRGFPCTRGHTIRHKEKHWCYHCAHLLQQNVCGFDLNYIDSAYKIPVKNFFDRVDIRGEDECWEYEHHTFMHQFPSYRSIEKQNKKTDNQSPLKVMYNIARGDIGNYRVRRNTDLCTNAKCVNPRHLYSRFDHGVPPGTIHPLVIDFDYKKIAHYSDLKRKGLLDAYLKKSIRNSILHPTLVPERLNNIE